MTGILITLELLRQETLTKTPASDARKMADGSGTDAARAGLLPGEMVPPWLFRSRGSFVDTELESWMLSKNRPHGDDYDFLQFV